MRAIRSIKVWIEGFREVDQLVEDLVVMYEFYEADEASETDVEKAFAEALSAIESLEAKNMLRNEEDRLGAVL